MADGKPAGTITLRWSDPIFWGEQQPDSGYVHKLAVRPVYAGLKIGLEMLKWAEATARKAGKRFLRLDCLATGRKIRDYYEQGRFSLQRRRCQTQGCSCSVPEGAVIVACLCSPSSTGEES
jgi:GNAT superfamily N-acetyltransferase